MNLVEFLRARLDEEHAEVAALHKACMERWYSTQELFDGWGPLDWDEAEHIATYGPGRMLAEIDAKRRILDAAEEFLHDSEDGPDPMASIALRLLALPYADHPDHRDEWRP